MKNLLSTLGNAIYHIIKDVVELLNQTNKGIYNIFLYYIISLNMAKIIFLFVKNIIYKNVYSIMIG